MPAILDRLLRIGEGKILRQLEAIAKAVNAIEDDFVKMSDAELQGMTAEFKARLEQVAVAPRGDLARALDGAVSRVGDGAVPALVRPRADGAAG